MSSVLAFGTGLTGLLDRFLSLAGASLIVQRLVHWGVSSRRFALASLDPINDHNKRHVARPRNFEVAKVPFNARMTGEPHHTIDKQMCK